MVWNRSSLDAVLVKQAWHVDGGHLFGRKLDCPPHCLDVFIPLIDVPPGEVKTCGMQQSPSSSSQHNAIVFEIRRETFDLSSQPLDCRAMKLTEKRSADDRGQSSGQRNSAPAHTRSQALRKSRLCSTPRARRLFPSHRCCAKAQQFCVFGTAQTAEFAETSLGEHLGIN